MNDQSIPNYYEPSFDAHSWTVFLDEYQRLFQAIIRIIQADETIELHKTITKKYQQKSLAELRNNKPKDLVTLEEIIGTEGLDKISDLFVQESASGLYKLEFILSEQFIVVLSSIIEDIIKNVFVCLFYTNPKKMYQYIGEKEKEGHIKITKIVEAPTKKHLLISLANSASHKAAGGKFEKQINHLQQVSNNAFNKDLLGKMNDIVVRRNLIVHEYSKNLYDWVDNIVSFPEHVVESFKYLLDFIVDIKNVLQKFGIDVEWYAE